MFWIPQGWLPNYIEWLLAFPKAPMGGVSIQIWWIACVSVIQLIGEVVVAARGMLVSKDSSSEKSTAGNSTPSLGSEKVTVERKKEL